MKKMLALILITAMMLPVACAGPQTNTEKGTAYGAIGGAAAGALAGQVIGRNTKATLTGAAIGAAIGGLAGAGIGQMMDKQEQAFQQALANSEATTVRREQDMMSQQQTSAAGQQQQAPPQIIALTLKGDVVFDTNSSAVKPGMYSELDRIAQVMTQYPQTTISVEGHTDSRGSDALNQRLSEQRADSVKNLLIQRGVDPSRIRSAGFGKSLPIATNDTEAGRQMNRRVEIKIRPMTNS